MVKPTLAPAKYKDNAQVHDEILRVMRLSNYTPVAFTIYPQNF